MHVQKSKPARVFFLFSPKSERETSSFFNLKNRPPPLKRESSTHTTRSATQRTREMHIGERWRNHRRPRTATDIKQPKAKPRTQLSRRTKPPSTVGKRGGRAVYFHDNLKKLRIWQQQGQYPLGCGVFRTLREIEVCPLVRHILNF